MVRYQQRLREVKTIATRRSMGSLTRSLLADFYRDTRQMDGTIREERVLQSREWAARARPLRGPPRRYPDRSQADERYVAFRGESSAVRHIVDCEVAYAIERAEQLWVSNFDVARCDNGWCSNLNLFDSRFLLGHPLPGSLPDTIRRGDAGRRREKHSGNRTGRFVSEHEVLGEWICDETLHRWPRLPRDWGSLEVPGQLKVGSLRVVATHGLELARNDYHPSLCLSSPSVWALWCAVHTFFVQDVLVGWVHELASSRLFWISDRLVAAIREVKLGPLIGDRETEELVERALRQLYKVRWELVDPAASTRPPRNDFDGPIYQSGDVVPFNPYRPQLDCIGRLLAVPRYSLRRDNIIAPNFREWRDNTSGNGLAPAGFFATYHGGVHVDEMRVGGPSPYELRSYNNVRSHYQSLSGRYVRPPTRTASHRGIDPTRARNGADSQRFGFTRHQYEAPPTPRLGPISALRSGFIPRIRNGVPAMMPRSIPRPMREITGPAVPASRKRSFDAMMSVARKERRRVRSRNVALTRKEVYENNNAEDNATTEVGPAVVVESNGSISVPGNACVGPARLNSAAVTDVVTVVRQNQGKLPANATARELIEKRASQYAPSNPLNPASDSRKASPAARKLDQDSRR